MKTLVIVVMACLTCLACESSTPSRSSSPSLWAVDGVENESPENFGPDAGEDAGPSPSVGQDVDDSVSQDAMVSGSDTDGASAPDTTPPSVVNELPCNATTTVRLVAKDSVFYDKLLDIKCDFYLTEKGMRCIPLNTMVGPSYRFKKQVGNATFPSAALFPVDSTGIPQIFNDMACLNPTFVTGDVFDYLGNPKPDPKYGFTFVPDANRVKEAYSLYTPTAPYVMVYWEWKNNKQGYCVNDLKAYPKGCNSKSKVGTTKAIAATGGWSNEPKGLCGKDKYMEGVSAYQTAIMYSSGLATNPKCPGVFGLEIFASQ